MKKIAYVHWNASEAEVRREPLAEAGYDVLVLSAGDAQALRALRDPELAAVLIDLERLPSHGRSVGWALRSSRATRHVPLVFFEGDAEKTARLRAELPDAVYTTWARWKRDLKRAIAAPPSEPIVPRSTSGYSGTPLWKKLGAKAGAPLLLLDAPAEFEPHLRSLPAGVDVKYKAGATYALGLCFFTRRAELAKRWPSLVKGLAAGGSLWIAWPKQASSVETDLSSEAVRTFGLEQGLVDTKVCAVDATWSALRFQRRRAR